jgi:hypothetical protein
MALLSFRGIDTRAYRLKASNAAPPISTFSGAMPVQLKMRDAEGSSRNVEVDFVIAGTGYDVDVSRLKFLDPEIVGRIHRTERAPTLNINFESSVPGLHFTGPLSFMCFGPLFRFVTGAEVTARRLARRFSHQISAHSTWSRPNVGRDW